MTADRLRLEILDLAAEDYYQLHEVAWRLRTVLSEDCSMSECIERAADHVKALLAEESVALFRREGAQGKEQALAPEEARRVLQSRRHWQPQHADEEQIVIGATAGGRRRYREQERGEVQA
ncbi:MAG: hypothetical protein BRD37_06560 [Bacteroidetes bacterium QH_8_67_23]|nr:MAG: hypothetical protein BRD37_06560 [Bacteroidetes bacterium QH_8_67_23]